MSSGRPAARVRDKFPAPRLAIRRPALHQLYHEPFGGIFQAGPNPDVQRGPRTRQGRALVSELAGRQTCRLATAALTKSTAHRVLRGEEPSGRLAAVRPYHRDGPSEVVFVTVGKGLSGDVRPLQTHAE